MGALKGLTIKLGGDTTGLNKALTGVNKKSRELSSELGQINKLLKLDPHNTELLAQKQKVLADAISNTEEKLATLREAERQVQEQFERGEVSEEQYRALQREIIATEKKLDGYKNAAKETAEEVEKLGNKSKDSAEDIERTEKAAKDADEALDEMGSTIGTAVTTGLGALVAAAAAAIGALVGLAESTREYRTEMGKLNTAFQQAEFSTGAAYETYSSLQGVLGETDQAVEAANHLAKLAGTEEDLSKWTDILTGAYATFGASLPVEGLAEAANETIRVGQVTGPLADALNWAAREGETFGVALKENVEFTELSSQELKKLTEEQQEQYKATKEQYDAIEDYNKRVTEATSAEELFNIALENCSDEQERQQLITDTLTKLYKGAATQYKKTNKEVIRANEASEKWTRTLADMGGYVEPMVTDVKELGAAFMDDMREPLKKVVDFIRQKVLPALTNVGNWVKQNKQLIIDAVAGVTAVLVTHKVAVMAAELASKGLTVATLAQAAAQKALNAVMAASPWGLLATAIVGVTAVLVTLANNMGKVEERADVLTTEERKLMEAANETAQAFRDQKDATDKALGNITAEMEHTQALANELQGLADASGRVKEKDQERVNFILNELNSALGTEYSMVDGMIQQYDSLKNSIDSVIQAKLANSLVEAANADYVAAIQAEDEAMKNLVLAEKDYQAQKPITAAAEKAYLDAWNEYQTRIKDGTYDTNETLLQQDLLRMANLRAVYDTETGLLTEKEGAYNEAAAAYGEYYNTIANYEEAQTAVLEGNYEKAVDILSKKGDGFGEYSDRVDEETAKVLDALYKEAIDAGIEAERTRQNFEKGVDGYTEEMVKEAETGYKAALDKFANAYADAEGVGGDISDGLSGGMESRRGSLYAKATSLVSGIISAMRTAADSHSPARKTIAFGEDVGEGAEIGIENKTDDVAEAARHQAEAVLDAYGSQELAAQKALSNITARQAELDSTAQMAAATANSGVLDKILAAVKAGHVIVLDSGETVGALIEKIDGSLSDRYEKLARGW